jgi:hypothetical protein
MSLRCDAPEEGVTQAAQVAAASDCTLITRFYVPGNPAPGTIRTFGYLGDDPVALYVEYVSLGQNDAGKPRLEISGNAATLAASAIAPGWHRLRYRRTGPLHELTMGGVLQTSQTVDVSGETHTHQYLCTDTYTVSWAALFAEGARMWAASLSDGELDLEEASPTAVRTADLVLDTPLATDLLDVSGNGNHWSAYQSPDFFTFPSPSVGVTTVTETYSDVAMQCPAEWENGYKAPLVERFGSGQRRLSHPWTGEWRGATFRILFADTDLRFRQKLASLTGRYWTESWTVRMTNRDNRAALGLPYTVFVGPPVEINPVRPLGMEVILGDIISQGLLSDDEDQDPIPYRIIRDGFLGELTTISTALDLDTPEHIILGIHERAPGIDPPSPQGFQWTPTYLGIEADEYVWMIAGHACAEVPDVRAWTLDEEGALFGFTSLLADPDWKIPGVGMIPKYEDRRSGTFGNMRRYCLLRALVGNVEADAVIAGEKILTCFVHGMEPNGDGSGAVETDRFQQWKWLMKNHVANRGPLSYMSGAYLASPVWDVFGVSVSVIDEPSFDAASAIGNARMPEEGYPGAVIIGATSADRHPAKKWVADAARSCGARYGDTHFGQFRVGLLHPTLALQAAATLYTDAYHMLRGSFATDFPWNDKIGRVPWRTDYEHSSGQWKTSGVYSNEVAIRLYGSAISGDQREYPWAPGETAGNHVAVLEARVRLHPRHINRFNVTVGPDHNEDSLGYRDLFEYVRYRAYPAIANSPSEIRLGQIVGHQVQAGGRQVQVDVLDCGDLIGYDAYEAPPAAGGNDACAMAMVITEAEATGVGGYTREIDTSTHDTDVTAPVLTDGNGGTAYGAAYWSYTPSYAQKGHVTTGLSEIDTVLGWCEGDCGSLTEIASNDNSIPGVFTTSFIEITGSGPLILEAGVTYHFLVHGYGPADKGKVVFTFFAEPL